MFSQDTTEEILEHIDKFVTEQKSVRQLKEEGMVLPIESVLRVLVDYQFISWTDYEYFIDKLGGPKSI